MDVKNELQPNVATPTANVVKSFAIVAGERFMVTTPDGLVSETGVRELSGYLAIQHLGLLPPDFEPVWATRRGTLPKRLSSHVYKSAGVKMTAEQVSAIGNIARRNSSDAQTYHCDFTNRIDWSAGDFGDYGSCAWGDKAGMKDMVSENGYAIRFYRESGGGYARAWVAPIGEGKLIVFNAYGLEPITVARILSVHFACGYKRITLTNNGSDCGVLWINGGSAYVLGDWSQIQEISRHNLEWPEIDHEEEDHAECAECGEDMGVRDDCEDYAFDRYGDTVPCCEDCSFTCGECDERFVNDCERRDGRNSYCRACHDDLVRAREEKAQERAEEIERLEKKAEDCQAIIDDLESELDTAKDDLKDVEDRLSELREEGE